MAVEQTDRFRLAINQKCEGIVLTIPATLELVIGPRSRAEPLAPGSIAERVAWLSDLAVMVAPSRLASGEEVGGVAKG